MNGIVARAVRVGGLTKDELLSELRRAGVELNEMGRALFAFPGFTTAAAPLTIDTVELAVADLGFGGGAVIATLLERARRRGLQPCPLELGPHLRLQDRARPRRLARQPPARNRAPPGSVTVVSAPVSDDEDVPKGFYLRHIDGVPWLRGYRSGPEHVWSPQDRLLFRSGAG